MRLSRMARIAIPTRVATCAWTSGRSMESIVLISDVREDRDELLLDGAEQRVRPGRWAPRSTRERITS
ncbi:MAG: hypothetical protein R2695_07510 [Acidimicrobiales bacterium]